jgi:hypothetical protein
VLGVTEEPQQETPVVINREIKDARPVYWRAMTAPAGEDCKLINQVRATLGRMETNVVAESPLLTVTVGLPSGKVRALIDSGADLSLVQASVVKNIDLPIWKKDVSITGIGHGSAVGVTGSIELDLLVHGVLIGSHTFLIVEGIDMLYPMFIGADFLKKNQLTVNMADRKLAWEEQGGHRKWELQLGGDQTECKVYQVNYLCKAREAMTILPEEEKKISLSVEEMDHIGGDCSECGHKSGQSLYFEPRNTGERDSIKLWPSLFSYGKDHQLFIRGHSIGKVPREIKKGEILGTVCTLMEMDERPEDSQPSNWTVEELREGTDLQHLMPGEKETAVDMMMKYIDIFSTSNTDLGRASMTKHRIELLNDTPIYQRPRRLPEPVANEIDQQCDELLAVDVIEKSKSPWSSPIVPVKKKDGTIRMCVDYRKLNTVTKPDRFPMPNISDQVFGLYGMKFFTTLDLVRGYHQMPIEEDSRECTAFSTTRGHYQYKRLPFGLRNAPAAFQREMQEVLKEFAWNKVMVYIDDVLIMERDFDRHLELVRKVLQTLYRYGLKIKPSKCHWFKAKVDFLGHVVSADGLAKQPDYVEKIVQFPRPRTVKELQTFLGLVGFQRKFIEGCSMIAKPLNAWLGKRQSTVVRWDEDMDRAFRKLKHLMREEVELVFPAYSPESPFLELWVDASGVGAGATLGQKQGVLMKIIAYASVAFSKPQCNYSTIERELTALRWGVKTFKAFLYGRKFILHTDHQPLVYLQNMRLVDSRLARTYEDLADFEFEIRYTPGVKNEAADALSRAHVTTSGHLIEPDQGLLPDGLKVIRKVAGGGDSMMDSLLDVMEWSPVLRFRRETNSGLLRKKLVEKLTSQPEKHGRKLDRQSRKELRLMQLPGVFPYQDLLTVFADLYDVQVFVHYGGKTPDLSRATWIVNTYRREYHSSAVAVWYTL